MKWIKALFTNLWKLYVGAIFCATAILLYPVFLIILALPTGKRTSFGLFVFWSRIFQILCLYPIRNNLKIKASKTPKIYVANHTSYIDIFLMFCHLPKNPFFFMGKGEILKYPIIGTYFKNLNVPVHRGSIIKSAMAYRQAKSLIEEGYSLVIFPEGGIPDHNPSKVGNFKNGAFRLAADTGVKIQPISIINHYKLFSDLSDFFGKARPGISSFYFHPEMSVLRDEIYNQKETCREIIQKGLNNHH